MDKEKTPKGEAVDEKSFIKAKIKYWKQQREKFQQDIQEAFNRDMSVFNAKIATLEEMLYERFPEEKPAEQKEDKDANKDKS